MDEKQSLTIAQAWRQLLMEAAEGSVDAQPIYNQMMDASESYFYNDVSLVQLLERHGYMINRDNWEALFPSQWGTDQVIMTFSDKSCLLLGSFPNGQCYGNCTTELLIYEIVQDLATVASHLTRKEAGHGHQPLS